MANLLGLAVHESVVGARCTVMKLNTPIALFTFNRPEHTRRTLEALAGNAEFLDSPLVIYSDGARNAGGKKQVEETRRIIHDWPHPNKTIIERDCNWGLANSIINGVSLLCEQFGRVIVVEDDLMVSECFLNYMNSGLNCYINNQQVMSIHGYCYPIDDLPETFFLKGADCWGWATWKDRWKLFEKDGDKLLRALKEKSLMDRFDIFGGYNYSKMLKKQIAGKNDSWAIRWYASALLNDKLTLYPGKSLVHNIGNDLSGRHCRSRSVFDVELFMHRIHVGGIDTKENRDALQQFSKFLRSTKQGFLPKVLQEMNRFMGSCRNG